MTGMVPYFSGDFLPWAGAVPHLVADVSAVPSPFISNVFPKLHTP